MITAAAAIVLAVLATSVLRPGGSGGPDLLRPQVATAAELRTRVATALATATTLRGDLTFECAVTYGECQAPETGGDRTTLRWSLLATAEGNERITGIGGTGSTADMAYRVDQRILRSTARPDQGIPAEEISGLPAGPPDYTIRSPLAREYASLVRAFLASDDNLPVTEIDADGRPAWQVSVPVQPNKLAGPGNSGDRPRDRGRPPEWLCGAGARDHRWPLSDRGPAHQPGGERSR